MGCHASQAQLGGRRPFAQRGWQRYKASGCYKVTMRLSRPNLPADPLALSSGALSRLLLAAAVLAGLWLAVGWAMGA